MEMNTLPQTMKELIGLSDDDPRIGCPQCKFGVVDQPDLWHLQNKTGVPFFIARALAMDLDGTCYIVYCDCVAGQNALVCDQRIRLGINNIHTVGVSGKQGWLEWSDGEPHDHIPPLWWKIVKNVCEDHVNGNRTGQTSKQPVA